MLVSPLITPATMVDAGEILTMQRAAYLAEARRYSDLHLPPLVETLDEVRAALSGPDPVLAARLGHRLVGSVRARIDGDTAHLARLAVVPDLQGQGIGSLLLAAVEAACAGRVSRFTLFTGAESEENLRLYRRHGYRIVDYRPDVNGNRCAVLDKPADASAEAPDRPVTARRSAGLAEVGQGQRGEPT
jgi:ribosomal protein S18 acetylase RimI-like enzyme